MEAKYIIRKARPTGGKAGTGHNKTSTIQVVYNGVFVVKHLRYTVGDLESYKTAKEKAIKYCGKDSYIDKTINY